MRQFLITLAFFIVAATCRGDGMVIPSIAVPTEVRIPDQRALIHFSNGVERLVIETRFTGSGTNFAWVVPLPSVPVVEKATSGLFPTLQCIFQPRLRHDVTQYFRLFIGIMSLGYLVRYVRRGKPSTVLDVLAGVGISLVLYQPFEGRTLVCILLFLVARFVVESVRGKYPSLLLFLTAVLALFLMAGLLLPALSTAKAGISPSLSAEVSVLDRKIVGVFDTTTISPKDPKALQIWLKANDFATPANRNQAIASYVKDGWVFVAAKVRRDNPDPSTVAPHPLSFTFKTERPVYPMRLTGIDNGPVAVDLYVFGPERATAPHFKVERCGEPLYLPDQGPRDWRSLPPDTFKAGGETLKIGHPLLKEWVSGAPVATKLTANLTPEEMRDDVWISWTRYAEAGAVKFSSQGAWIFAANFGVGLLALAILALFFFHSAWKIKEIKPERIFWPAIAACPVVSILLYAVLPKTAVTLVRGFPRWQTVQAIQIVDSLCSQENKLEDVRADLEAGFSGGWSKYYSNQLSGGLLREEDSPGNFTLRQNIAHLDYTFYDATGAPIEK